MKDAGKDAGTVLLSCLAVNRPLSRTKKITGRWKGDAVIRIFQAILICQQLCCIFPLGDSILHIISAECKKCNPRGARGMQGWTNYGSPLNKQALSEKNKARDVFFQRLFSALVIPITAPKTTPATGQMIQEMFQ